MKTTKNLNIWLAMSMFLLSMVSTAVAQTIYVDDEATGANNGSSWAGAYNYLQDALAVAVYGDEIRVAEGIYKPDQGAGVTTGDRTATFQLKNGVTLKGGYAGFGEPDPNARDVHAYETILSGDLDGNDVDVNDPADLLNEPTRAENSLHVVTGSDTDSNAVLDGISITAGNANGSYPDYCGGGMYNDSGSPTLINCIFRDNKAGYYEYIGPVPLSDNSSSIVGNDTTVRIPPPIAVWRGRGAGMYCVDSNVTLTNCKFSGNSTKERGGGMYNSGSSPTLINCTFSENLAISGGGMSNRQGSSPTLTKCTFRENSAIGGGGMRNSDNSNPTLTNCTFQRNSASWSGGMDNSYSSPTLTNCTFSRNSVDGDGGGMNNYKSNPILANCFFSGNSANKSCGGGMVSIKSSPTLTSCTFSGNSAKYGGGMYNYSGSPTLTNCMISGNLAVYGAGMYNRGWYDDVRNPKLTNCTFAANSALSGNALACDSSEQKYPSNVQVTNCILWDGGDEIWNNDGSTITITYSDVQNAWPGEGNIDADPCFVDLNNGDYHLLLSSPCIDTGDNTVVTVATDLDGNARIVNGIVDMGAYEYQGPRTIYVDADATGANNGSSWTDAYNYLQDALTDANSGDEIWVAQGIYTPDSNSANPNGSGDREATFQLKNGVAIRGGYAGYGQPDPNARDIELYETILSGDLYGDDGPDFANNDENSYHVVTSIRTDETAVLDGFTITAGNSWRSGGGGMINKYGSPIVLNCTFTGNWAGWTAGGMSNFMSNPLLINCTFAENWAGIAAGGLGNYVGSHPTLIGCMFSGNSAGLGGGMTDSESASTLINCTLTGNSARCGGGLDSVRSDTLAINCTFSGNSAENAGGGIFESEWGVPRTINCIFWANSVSGDINELAQIEGYVRVDYSCIQGWSGTLEGVGNIDTDPCFADPNNGDYHLKSQAGRWEPSSQSWVKDDVTSPCIDAGNPENPIGEELFPNGGIINMGAYGGTAEASKSYFGEPVCETIVAGDINGDCKVNFLDFRIMALHWLRDENQ